MQAQEMTIFDFLNSVKKVKTESQHRSFCFDINDAVTFYDTVKNGDFLGIFAFKKTEKKDEYVIIDGYSRLLLFSLLICAISNNNMDYEDFVLQLGQNAPKNLKIEFLNTDNDFYKAISTNYFDDLKSCPQILSDIYNMFLQRTALNSKKTKNLIKKILQSKAIFLIEDDGNISSNMLYEGLNKTFKPLSEYDLIKNYAQRICNEKKYIFNNYFLQIEKEYEQKNIQNCIIDFIKDYLTIQNNGKIPQNGKIYPNFKNFINKISRIRDIKQIFEDLYRYSKYYAQIITENITDEEIKAEIQHINDESAFDAYPYLMEVFEDWDKNNINKEMMLDILKMVNLFIEQRKSPNASKFVMTFAKLSSQINKMLALKDYTPRIAEIPSLTINKIVNN